MKEGSGKETYSNTSEMNENDKVWIELFKNVSELVLKKNSEILKKLVSHVDKLKGEIYIYTDSSFRISLNKLSRKRGFILSQS